MRSLVYLLLAFSIPTLGMGQDLTGKWRGYFTPSSDLDGKIVTYEIIIKEKLEEEEEEEGQDHLPRVQIELDRLNYTNESINNLELELEVCMNSFSFYYYYYYITKSYCAILDTDTHCYNFKNKNKFLFILRNHKKNI